MESIGAQSAGHDLARQSQPKAVPAAAVVRNSSLDTMKGLLVIFMVSSHMVVGLALSVPWWNSFRWILELSAFSGFFFAFGYTTRKAYLDRPTLPRRRVSITLAKVVVAYFLCALADGFFNGHEMSLKFILRTVTVQYLAVRSEFLLTYALILLCVLIVPVFFRKVVQKEYFFWPVVIGLLLISWIDFSKVQSIYLSLLVGSQSYSSFPLIQYLPLYLFGAYFAYREIRFSWAYLAGAILAILGYLVAQNFGWETRFPPNFIWIVGSMGAVYLVYLFGQLLIRLKLPVKPLLSIGRYSLFWLVMSNLFIDCMIVVLRYISLPVYWIAGVVIAGYVFIGFLGYVARD